MRKVPKVLKCNVTNIADYAYWESDDPNDPYVGYPYQWEITMSVTDKYHSDPNTPTPFAYTAGDIMSGDWLANGDGLTAEIKEIKSRVNDTIIIVVEDKNRQNTFLDPTMTGYGCLQFGDSYVFEVGEDGLPILYGIPEYDMPNPFQSDILSRFTQRNLKKNFYFYQEQNNFNIGDILYIDINDKTFKLAEANSPSVKNIVGVVKEVDYPGKDYFVISPLGNVTHDITPSLPGGRGDLIYLDTTRAGKLTKVKPDSWAQPIYLQLDADGKTGLLLYRGIDIVGPSGKGTSVQVVNSIPERDALKVSNGDQVFVTDTGQGEWALYLYKDVVGWIEISNKDSSNVDSRTVSVDLNFDSNINFDIYRVSPGTRITSIVITVIEAFDASSSITIGDSEVVDRLFNNNEVDLSFVGEYSTAPTYQYSGTLETMIQGFYASNGATKGRAKILMTYV